MLTFQQEFFNSTSLSHIVLAAQLINNLSNKVIANQQWEINIPAPGNNPESGVKAANNGMASLIAELEKF